MPKSDTFLKFSWNSVYLNIYRSCRKVTHFWEFGWTQNVSLFSTIVYLDVKHTFVFMKFKKHCFTNIVWSLLSRRVGGKTDAWYNITNISSGDSSTNNLFNEPRWVNKSLLATYQISTDSLKECSRVEPMCFFKSHLLTFDRKWLFHFRLLDFVLVSVLLLQIEFQRFFEISFWNDLLERFSSIFYQLSKFSISKFRLLVLIDEVFDVFRALFRVNRIFFLVALLCHPEIQNETLLDIDIWTFLAVSEKNIIRRSSRNT